MLPEPAQHQLPLVARLHRELAVDRLPRLQDVLAARGDGVYHQPGLLALLTEELGAPAARSRGEIGFHRLVVDVPGRDVVSHA